MKTTFKVSEMFAAEVLCKTCGHQYWFEDDWMGASFCRAKKNLRGKDIMLHDEKKPVYECEEYKNK